MISSFSYRSSSPGLVSRAPTKYRSDIYKIDWRRTDDLTFIQLVSVNERSRPYHARPPPLFLIGLVFAVNDFQQPLTNRAFQPKHLQIVAIEPEVPFLFH